MKKKHERMTCTFMNNTIITCLLPGQGNNSPLLKKDAQELVCFKKKTHEICISFQTEEGMNNMLNSKTDSKRHEHRQCIIIQS